MCAYLWVSRVHCLQLEQFFTAFVRSNTESSSMLSACAKLTDIFFQCPEPSTEDPASPHYKTNLVWMAIRGPDAKVWKQQHLAPWQILQADLLPASKLCLGLLHGLAADGLSGLPRASGSQSWLSFDSEDFTHFYSFVKKGPSKCFMKPTLENINGSNFAFEKAEVNVYLDKRHGMLKLGLHMSVCLSMNFYPKVLGEKPVMCYHLSVPQGETVWLPGKTET